MSVFSLIELLKLVFANMPTGIWKDDPLCFSVGGVMFEDVFESSEAGNRGNEVYVTIPTKFL